MPGLYVHIPFCSSRCIYCDFYSTTALALRDRYVDALCREMEHRASEVPCNEVVETIYLGGGTPSQLSIDHIKRILQTIHRHYSVAPQAEITMEMNPDDVTSDYVDQLRQTPINRISLGIQTFDDPRLQLLHRRHTAQQAILAVKKLQKWQFNNVSIDLMFGFPGQTLQQWENDIQQAINLGVQHISAYTLMYEEGTRLTRLRDKGEISEIDELLSLQMYNTLCHSLQRAGFEHYEISNFALPHHASRHNSNYWNDTPYLGFGAAAHSYNGKQRSWNPAHLYIYIKGIEQGTLERETENLTSHQRYDEHVMTRLRTAKGIDLDQLKQEFGTQLHDYCLLQAQPHLRRNHLRLTNEHKLRLNQQGIFISNDIISDLMLAD